MNRKAKNIIIFSGVILLLGLGTYSFLKTRSRRNISDRQEKRAGKEVKEWEELKENLPSYLPYPDVKFEDAKDVSSTEKVSEKIFPFSNFAILDSDGKSVKTKITIYYYSDGDVRIYDTTDGKKYVWLASGKWISPFGTSVKIVPKEAGKNFKIEEGFYSGDSVKLMLNKIFRKPLGYYNIKTKLYEV